MRALTKGDAIGYSFHSSDETGFPRALPPVRKIGLGRRALAGMVPGTKVLEDGAARFESSLERDFFVLLEFNPDVQRWDPQPVRIRVDETGQDYVPDVLVSFYPTSEKLKPRRVLYEVKYRSELQARWAEFKPRFRAAYRYARKHGWKFKIITEREIRQGGLLWNAKFLLPYTYDEPDDAGTVLLETNLRRLGPTTTDALLKACSSDRWEQAKLLTTLWNRVARGYIRTDLTNQLNMKSEIWVHE